MYKELIAELSKDNERTQIQLPADPDEIKTTEEYIGYSFPDSLKELYLELNGDSYLILSLDQISETVTRNRKFFTECFDDYEVYLERVDRYIPFATNGCGDYYCFKLNSEGEADESAIHIWEHETFESHPVAADIKDTIIMYYNNGI